MRSLLAILVALAACGQADARGVGSVDLGIPDRSQAPESPKAGWCGETAIQQSMLYYGAFVPQRLINRAGKPKHPDLYWGDMAAAMSQLGVRHRRWSRGNLPAFLRWIRRELDKGRPVLAGMKIHPTEHPNWGLDHMILVVGYDRRGLFINTTWGRRVHRTYAQLASSSKGLAFANRYRRYHAFAIDGIKRSGAHRVALEARIETADRLRARAVARGLVVGRAYVLERYQPRARRWRRVRRFRASSRTYHHELVIDKRHPAYFRVRSLR